MAKNEHENYSWKTKAKKLGWRFDILSKELLGKDAARAKHRRDLIKVADIKVITTRGKMKKICCI